MKKNQSERLMTIKVVIANVVMKTTKRNLNFYISHYLSFLPTKIHHLMTLVDSLKPIFVMRLAPSSDIPVVIIFLKLFLNLNPHKLALENINVHILEI